jgi:hypothetical protein
VLPAWATITLAAISALAGIVGGLSVTWIRIRFDRTENAEERTHQQELQEQRLEHERAEQWRDRLVRAADDFSTGTQQALLRVHEAIQAVVNRGDRKGTVAEAERVIGEAIARVGRVKLLFGEDSEPAKIADRLLPQLELTLGYVKGRRPGGRVREAWDAIEKAYARQREFTRAAREAIRQ